MNKRKEKKENKRKSMAELSLNALQKAPELTLKEQTTSMAEQWLNAKNNNKAKPKPSPPSPSFLLLSSPSPFPFPSSSTFI